MTYRVKKDARFALLAKYRDRKDRSPEFSVHQPDPACHSFRVNDLACPMLTARSAHLSLCNGKSETRSGFRDPDLMTAAVDVGAIARLRYIVDAGAFQWRD
jgi:hypothetical protein